MQKEDTLSTLNILIHWSVDSINLGLRLLRLAPSIAVDQMDCFNTCDSTTETGTLSPIRHGQHRE
jgi:hypothetical protein